MAKHVETKTVTKTTYTCDICGRNADGDWSFVERTNEDISAEYGLPIDMCKEHADLYSTLIFRSQNPFEFMKERYEGFSEDKKKALIEKLKELEEEINDC